MPIPRLLRDAGISDDLVCTAQAIVDLRQDSLLRQESLQTQTMDGAVSKGSGVRNCTADAGASPHRTHKQPRA